MGIALHPRVASVQIMRFAMQRLGDRVWILLTISEAALGYFLHMRQIKRSPRLGKRNANVMFILLIGWFISALSLIIVASLIPGFQVSNFGTALIAALIIGLINGTLGLLLKILTFPITILTFGLFLLVINALILQFATNFVSGFVIQGFGSAFIGAIILALVNMALRALVFE